MATSDMAQESEESDFVPQSDDDENMWDIDGIVEEDRGKYKVKWAGENPATGKGWRDSWVKKSEVTPDVAEIWKEEKAKRAGPYTYLPTPPYQTYI